MGTSYIMLQLQSRHLEITRNATLSVLAWDPRSPTSSSGLAPGSSSLLPDALPYGCLGSNCCGSTFSEASSSRDTGSTSSGCCHLQKHTHNHIIRCMLKWAAPGCWGVWSVGSFHLVYFTLRKRKSKQQKRSWCTSLSDSEHPPHPEAQPWACGWSFCRKGHHPSVLVAQTCKLVFSWFSGLVLFTH